MNKKRFILIISILLVVVVLGIATSYSLFTYNVTKNTNFKLVIGTLELKIENTQTEDKIIMENVVPTKDSEGIKQRGYTFTIKNTGTIDSYYTVYLDDILLEDYGERLDNSYVKLNVLNHKNNQSKTTRLSSFEGDRVIASGILEKGKNVTYTVKMWVDYKAGNDAQNKYFSTQIRVVGEQVNAVVYQDKVLNGTDPVLSDNLVPVKIDDKGTVTKANTEEEWYSYEDKKWANAVVLKDRYDTDTIYDLSGNNNNATIYGATMTDEGLNFDGINDYAKIDLLDWKSTTEFTIEFEAKVFDSNNLKTIFESSENSNNYEGSFYINSNEYGNNDLTLAMKYPNSSLINHKYADKIIEEKYQKYTITFNSNNNYNNFTNIYVNGVKQQTIVPSSDYFNLGGDISGKYLQNYSFFIGSRNGELGFTKMILKNLKIYTKELSEEEINNNITTTDKLILLYDLDDYEDNEIIPESSIESYFVWIPKYSYQLWDLGNYSSLTSLDSTKLHAIPIKFGTTNTDDSVTGECTTPGVAGESGNCKVGDYMTHPSFLAFDSTGFWVGKFETGYDGATNNTAAMVNVSDSSKVIVKPNVYSWRNNTVGNMFETSYNYIREDDSHMMKNTEWGAVAYLQHSNYGGQGSLRINNVNNITGYSAKEEPTLGYNTTSIEGNRYENVQPGTDGTYSVNYFNNLSSKSSTTGNYSGIYDMSGCSWEYVMGYDTGATEIGGGSFITDIYSDFFTNKEWEKYYDKYTSISTLGFNNRILGDATGEMGPFYELVDPDNSKRQSASWYDEYSQFFYSSLPWLRRGGFYANGIGAGIFAFYPNHGTVEVNHSFRIVLTPTK